jgi:hypothetical protein
MASATNSVETKTTFAERQREVVTETGADEFRVRVRPDGALEVESGNVRRWIVTRRFTAGSTRCVRTEDDVWIASETDASEWRVLTVLTSQWRRLRRAPRRALSANSATTPATDAP